MVVGVREGNGLEPAESYIGDMIEVCKNHPHNGCMLHAKVREQRIFIHQRTLVPEVLSGP